MPPHVLPSTFLKTNLCEPFVHCLIITLPGTNYSDTNENESYHKYIKLVASGKWPVHLKKQITSNLYLANLMKTTFSHHIILCSHHIVDSNT